MEERFIIRSTAAAQRVCTTCALGLRHVSEHHGGAACAHAHIGGPQGVAFRSKRAHRSGATLSRRLCRDLSRCCAPHATSRTLLAAVVARSAMHRSHQSSAALSDASLSSAAKGSLAACCGLSGCGGQGGHGRVRRKGKQTGTPTEQDGMRCTHMHGACTRARAPATSPALHPPPPSQRNPRARRPPVPRPASPRTTTAQPGPPTRPRRPACRPARRRPIRLAPRHPWPSTGRPPQPTMKGVRPPGCWRHWTARAAPRWTPSRRRARR